MYLSKLYDSLKIFEESLKCEVCKKCMSAPVLNARCAHTLCQSCVDKQVDMFCKICKTHYHRSHLIIDRSLKELVAEVEEFKNYIEEKNSNDDINNDICSTEHFKDLIENSKLQDSADVASIVKESISSPIVSSRKDKVIKKTPENQSLKTPRSRVTKTAVKRLSSNSISSPSTAFTPTASPGNINKKNLKGETALQRAVIKSDMQKTKELLKNGASVNTQDNNGWTPLHEASNRGFLEIAKILLDNGAHVNVPSLKDNITPLHDALLNDQLAMALLLASRGGDLQAKTTFGYSPLDLCKTDEDRKKLSDACSTFVDADTLMPDSKLSNVSNNKIVLLSSNLNEEQLNQLQKCAEMLKAEITDDYNSEVTHIVTSCDNTGNCTRTMKTLLGILSGKWLMNFQWIEICLEYKKKVDEDAFEVQGTKNHPDSQGPKRGRQNQEQKLPGLFDGLFFYLYGSFNKPTPSREELYNLIHRGGGKVLSREPKPETVSMEPYCVPFHARNTPMDNYSHVVFFQDKPPRGTQVKKSHICTSQVMWLIECISKFELLEPKRAVANK